MNNTASKFNWNQDSANNLVHDAAIEVRVVRPLLKLYGQQSAYTTNIVGHPIRNGQQDKGSPLNIPINQFLTPLILSCDIRLQQEQFGDADALNTLAVEAAYRVSAAEDAVILLGKDASCFLDKLGGKANREQLAAQVGLLPPRTPSLKNDVTSFLKHLYRKACCHHLNCPAQRIVPIFAMWFAAVCPSAFAADKPIPKYTITDIGVLPGTDTDSTAYDINSAGTVTGSSGQYDSSFGFSSETAFIWKPTFPNGTSGALTSLVGLPGYICTDEGSPIHLGSDARAINSSDKVAGYSFTGSGDCLTETQHATVFSTDGNKDLGVPSGFFETYGLDIDSAGHVVGYAQGGGFEDSAILHAFFFDGTFHDLGSIPNYPFGQANAINDSGQIAGVSYTTDLGSERAFLHEGLGPITANDDLGTLPGGHNAGANALNTNGVVVGGSDNAGGTFHAFLYAKGKMSDLGTLGDLATSNSTAGAVNDSNDVVGNATAADGNVHAVIWKAAGEIADLNTLIDNPAGWVLTSAHSINNSGQIVGSGLLNGHYHAYLLTPESNFKITLETAKPCGTQDVTGNLTLANPAGSAVSIPITSTQPHTADVVSNVNVPEGETTATFKVTTHDVSTEQQVTLKATLNGTTASTTLTVQPLLSKLDTTPDEICSLNSAVATVTLACAATSPTTIALSSSDSQIGFVPETVVVPTGKTEETFNISGGETQPDVDVKLTATFESEKQTATLTVHPIIGNLAIKSATVQGGKTAIGVVTLTMPMSGKGCMPPTGGLRIGLFSDNSQIAKPAVSSIIMPTGANIGQFTIDTAVPTTETCPGGLSKDGTCAANITAVAAGSSATSSITVTPQGPPSATDVSQFISVIPSGFFLDHATGHFMQELELINQTASTMSITGPIAFVPVSSDPTSTWSLVGGFDSSHHALVSGVTKVSIPKGQPYVLLPTQDLPNPKHFNPGDVIFITVSFSDPSNAFINYSSVFLANGSF